MLEWRTAVVKPRYSDVSLISVNIGNFCVFQQTAWSSRCLWHGHEEYLWYLRLEEVRGHVQYFKIMTVCRHWGGTVFGGFSLVFHFRKSSSILQCPRMASRKFGINAHSKKCRLTMQNSNLVDCDFRLKAFMTKYCADRSGRTCFTVLDISNTGLTECNPA
jgi:hypothetical protein